MDIKIKENVEIHQTLPEFPNLEYSELQKAWDKGVRIIKEHFNLLVENIYPVGTGFIAYNDEDYSKHLGFTWERELVGMIGVGKDTTQGEFDTVGKTGGEKTHKLTIEEMAIHNHRPSTAQNFVGVGYISTEAYGGTQTSGFSMGSQNTTGTTGGDTPHNNLQPYKVVNYWKRIS